MDLKTLLIRYNLHINGVIHIGAHFGQEYKTYKKLNVQNMIFFEPIIETFNILKSNIGNDPNVILYNIALGNKTGKETMFVEYNNNGQSNSILEPEYHKIQYPNIIFNDKKEINIDKLDNIDYNKDKYNFINIDVQGYELEVFRGSIETLKHIDYIMTEINRANLYKNCVLEDDLDLFLSKYNFKRVETIWSGGTWGDAFYIKEK